MSLARRAGALALAGAALAAAPARANTPQVDYMLECQGCHLADGSGSPGAVPPLVDHVGRYVTVPGGRAYLIRVPGSAQSGLSDAELADVLSWMVRRFGPAEVAARLVPFSAEEVAAHRARPLLEVEQVRAELLRRIEAAERAAGGPPSASPRQPQSRVSRACPSPGPRSPRARPRSRTRR